MNHVHTRVSRVHTHTHTYTHIHTRMSDLFVVGHFVDHQDLENGENCREPVWCHIDVTFATCLIGTHMDGIHTCDMTHPYVWHVSSICVYTCDLPHLQTYEWDPYVWHTSFAHTWMGSTRATCLICKHMNEIHVCDIPHLHTCEWDPHVQHASFANIWMRSICVTYFICTHVNGIHTCNMPHLQTYEW